MSRPDVLVVGAGIAGAACARELARAGLAVEIVDAAAAGGGATAEGMGHLLVMDDPPAQLALTRYSMELWRELLPELPPDCDGKLCGTLWVAEDEDDLEALDLKAERCRRHGVEHERLDGDELQALEPCLRPGLPGALRVPGDAIVYPPAVAEALVRRAVREHGARLRPGCVVTGLDGGADGAVARLADGTGIEAGWIVDAAGPSALELLPEPLPGLALTPRKGHLLITDRTPGFCRHQLIEVGYLKSAHSHQVDAVAFNLQARPNGQLLLGSSRQYGVSSRDADPSVIRRMVRRALDFVPGLGRLTALRVWTGFRSATEDHLPLLGPVPDHPRILLCAGHEGLGITNAPGCARLLADHVLGRESAISRAPYGVERGLHLSPLSKAPPSSGRHRRPAEIPLDPPSAMGDATSVPEVPPPGTGDVQLWIDGRELTVPPGTCLAAVLVERAPAGFGRSTGGAARAPLCGMGICYECRVTVDGRPLQLACQLECRDGMRVRTARGEHA